MKTTLKRYQQQFANILQNELIVLFLLILSSEVLFKWFRFYGITGFRIAAVIKLGIQLYILVFLLRNNRKEILWLLALGVLFLIGQFAINAWEVVLKNLNNFGKYAFVLLLLFYVNEKIKDFKKYQQLFTVFEWFVIINSFAVFVGLLLDIRLFESYSGPRFGYSGFLMKSGAATYFYCIALFYFAHRAFIRKDRSVFLFILTLGASLLLGTKSIFLFVLMLFIYIFFRLKLYKNWIVLLLVVLSVLGIVIFGNQLFNFYLDTSPKLRAIYEEDSLFSMLSSYRNVLFREEFLPIVKENWNALNYLFGGSIDMHYRSQFEFFDALYFFGIIGSAVYFYLFFKEFITFKHTKDTTYFIFSILLLAAISGNFFYNAVVAIYIVIIKCYFDTIVTTDPINNEAVNTR